MFINMLVSEERASLSARARVTEPAGGARACTRRLYEMACTSEAPSD